MKLLRIIFPGCLSLILLASCGTSKVARYEAGYGYDYINANTNTRQGLVLFADSAGYDAEGGKGRLEQKAEEKITYSASISLQVNNPDTISKQITLLAKNSNGYVQYQSSEYVVLKIPAAGMNDIIKVIESMGKVTDKNIVADNITDSYYDAAIRLDNLTKARQRYLELLAKAQTVEEMLKVEKELERVNAEMETLKGRLARMNNSVQYTTITVYLSKKVKPGILGYPFVWLYKGVSWLFVRN